MEFWNRWIDRCFSRNITFFIFIFQVPWAFTFGQRNTRSWRPISPSLFQVSFAKIIEAYLSLLSPPFTTPSTFWRGKIAYIDFRFRFSRLHRLRLFSARWFHEFFHNFSFQLFWKRAFYVINLEYRNLFRKIQLRSHNGLR